MPWSHVGLAPASGRSRKLPRGEWWWHIQEETSRDHEQHMAVEVQDGTCRSRVSKEAVL